MLCGFNIAGYGSIASVPRRPPGAPMSRSAVIAGLVGLVEREQRRADQDEHTVAIDLRGCRRMAGGRNFSLRGRKHQNPATALRPLSPC
jgi:hypothetical protein